MRAPRLDTARCSRSRHAGVRCRACADVCPEAAIVMGRLPRIDADNCTGCLLCAAECPTEAFDGPASHLDGLDWSDTAEVSRSLVCARAPRECTSQRVSCLGGMGAEDMIALAVLRGPGIQLNTSLCEQCENGPAVLDALEKARRHATEAAVVPEADLPTLDPRELEAVVRHRDLDRRGFFSLVAGATRELPRFVDEGFGRFESESWSSERMGRRRRLREALPPAKREVFDRSFGYEVQLQEACDHCCRCVGFCPTGALTRGRMERSRRLVVDEAVCIGCGGCESFCDKRAVVVRHRQGDQLGSVA